MFRTVEPQGPNSQVLASPHVPASVYFATLLGLLFAFPTVIPSGKSLESLAMSAGLSATGAWTVAIVAADALQILLIFGIVLFVERRPLASLGLVKPTFSDLGLGLAVFTGAAIVSGVWVLTLRLMFSHSMTNVAPAQLKRMLTLPIPAAVAVAVTAGFAEEIAERGFGLDRLRAVTRSASIASVAVLALALGAHVAFWGWRYAVLIGPSKLILILVYLWRGNLWPNIFAHTLVDSFPVLSKMALLAALSLFGARSYHAMLGDFRYRWHDYPGAVEEYTQALATLPGDPELLGERAAAEVMHHDYAAAIADLDIAISKQPGDSKYLIQRAKAFLYAGFYQKAKTDADKAVAAEPRHSALYQQRAEIEKWLKQPDKSIADLDQAIKLSKSQKAELYSSRGQAYLDNQQYDDGLRDLKLAAKLDPEDTNTLFFLAHAYYGKKQYAEEIAVLTRILIIESGNVEAYDARAVAHQWLGHYQAALDDYRAAAKLDSENAEAANAVAWFLSTCPNAKLRNGQQALKLANHVCELSDWSEANHIDTLAAAYAELGNFDEAILWEQRAIDLEDGSPGKNEFQQRLDLYRKRLPYRQEHPSR